MGRSKDIATSAKGDADYVNVSGDTMTGTLNVNGGNFYLAEDNAAAHRYMYLNTATSNDGHIILQRALSNKHQLTTKPDNSFNIYGYDASGDVFNIDSSGRVTTPYQPMFHAWCTDGSNGAVSAGSSPTSFHASLNVGGHFSSGTFTAPIAGKYRFYASILSGGANGYGLYQFTVNNSGSFGGGINSNWGQGYNYGTSNDKAITREVIVDLAANDYVKLQVNSGNANLYWASGYSYFGGHLIG